MAKIRPLGTRAAKLRAHRAAELRAAELRAAKLREKLREEEQQIADADKQTVQEIVERISNPTRLENHHTRTALRYHPDKGQYLSPKHCDFDTYVVLLDRCVIANLEFLSVQGVLPEVIDSIKTVVKKIVVKKAVVKKIVGKKIVGKKIVRKKIVRKKIVRKKIVGKKIVGKKIVGKTPSGEADSAEHGAQAAATHWIASLITPVFNILRYLCTVCRLCSFGLFRGM